MDDGKTHRKPAEGMVHSCGIQKVLYFSNYKVVTYGSSRIYEKQHTSVA